jgi:hypothetical protein
VCAAVARARSAARVGRRARGSEPPPRGPSFRHRRPGLPAAACPFVFRAAPALGAHACPTWQRRADAGDDRQAAASTRTEMRRIVLPHRERWGLALGGENPAEQSGYACRLCLPVSVCTAFTAAQACVAAAACTLTRASAASCEGSIAQWAPRRLSKSRGSLGSLAPGVSITQGAATRGAATGAPSQ